jgi:hypothetical protein
MRLAALCALVLSGCSVLFMETVPDKWTPATEPRCTDTSGWVLWDLLIAVGDGATIPLALSNRSHENTGDMTLNDQQRSNNQTMGLIAGAAAVDAAIRVASIVYGTHQGTRCGDARKKRDVFVRGQPKAPGPRTKEQIEIDQLKARLRELKKPPVAPAPPAESAPAKTLPFPE